MTSNLTGFTPPSPSPKCLIVSPTALTDLPVRVLQRVVEYLPQRCRRSLALSSSRMMAICTMEDLRRRAEKSHSKLRLADHDGAADASVYWKGHHWLYLHKALEYEELTRYYAHDALTTISTHSNRTSTVKKEPPDVLLSPPGGQPSPTAPLSPQASLAPILTPLVDHAVGEEGSVRDCYVRIPMRSNFKVLLSEFSWDQAIQEGLVASSSGPQQGPKKAIESRSDAKVQSRQANAGVVRREECLPRTLAGIALEAENECTTTLNDVFCADPPSIVPKHSHDLDDRRRLIACASAPNFRNLQDQRKTIRVIDRPYSASQLHEFMSNDTSVAGVGAEDNLCGSKVDVFGSLYLPVGECTHYISWYQQLLPSTQPPWQVYLWKSQLLDVATVLLRTSKGLSLVSSSSSPNSKEFPPQTLMSPKSAPLPLRNRSSPMTAQSSRSSSVSHDDLNGTPKFDQMNHFTNLNQAVDVKRRSRGVSKSREACLRIIETTLDIDLNQFKTVLFKYPTVLAEVDIAIVRSGLLRILWVDGSRRSRRSLLIDETLARTVSGLDVAWNAASPGRGYLPTLVLPIGIFSRLRILAVSGLSLISYIDPYEGIDEPTEEEPPHLVEISSKHFPALEHLVVRSNAFIGRVFDLPNLSCLELNDCPSLTHIGQSTHVCASLTSLKVVYCNELNHPLEPEGRHKNLQRLVLHSMMLDVLDHIGPFQELEHLELTACPDIESIASLPKLKTLHIRECPSLRLDSIDGLNYPLVEDISIWDVSTLKVVEGCNFVKSVEIRFTGTGRRLNMLSSVRNCPILQSLTISPPKPTIVVENCPALRVLSTTRRFFKVD